MPYASHVAVHLTPLNLKRFYLSSETVQEMMDMNILSWTSHKASRSKQG